MKSKYLLTGVALALLTAGGATIFSSSVDNGNVVAWADSTAPAWAALLKGDSGVGAGDSVSDINNYPVPSSGHFYTRSLTTEVFHLSLQSKFNKGGKISLSPDYSNNPGSTIPLIINKIYACNSASNSNQLIYSEDGQTLNQSDFTVNKFGNNYTINVPKDNTDTLVFTVSPLNSFENDSNAYQHPSYGVHVSAKSNDGYVDGSDYFADNGGFGILWGQYDQNDSKPVLLKTHIANITEGTKYDLDNQVENKSDFTSPHWILRDANGNSLKTTDTSSLSEGTYYATFYGSYNNLYSWDTVQINVRKPTPTPSPAPTPSPTPTPQPVQNGTQVTHYVDQNGNKIAPDETQTGNVGDGYSTTQKLINGYTFNKVIGNAFGTYTNGTAEVTYVYSESNTEPNPGDGKVSVKGATVYAIKKIGLYKSPNFKSNNRIKWYLKEKRVNRPEFIVKAYYRNKQGTLRYRVQQYNPYTRKYVKGTNGYITTGSKYVAPAYYSSLPKGKKVIVINHSGVNSYKDISLTKKVKNFKKGTRLQVKKVVKFKYATRYLLANGQYVTANKKFVIANAY